MLLVTKGASNILTVTLTEKVTISNPYFLLVVKGKSNQAWVKAVLTDSSNYTYRYNKFVFTEGVDITLPNAGDYTYCFYQNATNSTTIPSEANLLETGILRVVHTPATITSHSITKNTVIHES